jgi:adenylate cyclase
MKMKFNISYILCIWMGISSLSAQNRIIDSLYQVLKNEKADTNKVNTLNLLGDKLFRISSYDSSIVYSNHAKLLAEQLGFDKGLADAYSNMGTVISSQGNYSRGMEYTDSALVINRKIGNSYGMSNDLNIIGSIYNSMGNLSKALENFQQELLLCRQSGNKRTMSSSLGNIGLVYENQGDYTKALEYYYKSLAISKEIGNGMGISIMQSNIGGVYSDRGEYGKALEYDTNALAINKKIGYSAGIADDYNNIGGVYQSEQNYAKALEYYFKALAIYKQIGRKNEVAATFCAIGDIFTEQKNYAVSKKYLDSAFEISKQNGGNGNKRNLYHSLALLDSLQGDYKKWAEDYKSYSGYNDSLNNEKTVQEEMNYEFDRKTDSVKAEHDKMDAVAAKENQRQKVIKNSFIGGFSIMFIASGIFFFQRRRIAKEKKRSDKLLLNILPAETADELKATGEAKAKSFNMITVMFTDFKDFTKISEKLSPSELVAELHTMFQGFDNIIHKYNIEKIKTIGDSYMAAGGIPVPNQTHAKDVVSAALEIQQFIIKHGSKRASENKPVFEARIGINTGPVVAGIVGIKKFAYDIWGNTVNLASRIESNGEVGKVNISGSTYELVKNDFNCTYRGKINAKNKGEVDMYFVDGKL